MRSFALVALILCAVAPALAQMSESEKAIVETAGSIARGEGITTDPLGRDRVAGEKIYRSHLNEYISCQRDLIVSGKLSKDKLVPNKEDRSCLFEFALSVESCGVFFGKYLAGSGLNTTASNYCSFASAIAQTEMISALP